MGKKSKKSNASCSSKPPAPPLKKTGNTTVPQNQAAKTPGPTTQNTDVDDMESKKRKLSRRMSSDTISSFILTRATPEDASRAASLDQAISPSITQNRKKVERRLSAHKINDHLKTRPSQETLHEQGIFMYQPGHSSVTQNAARKLERKLTANTIKNFHKRTLGRRQESIDEETENVSTKMSIALLPDSVTLSRRMCSDSVNKMLVRKQSITMDAAVPIQVEEESRKRVKVARSLQATHRVLERKMSADNVKSLLENRPSVEQLRDYGIYPKHATGVAASLQEKHSAIDKHVRRKSLEMSLHTRPSLEEVGYLHKPAKRGPAYGDGNVDENSDYDYDDSEDSTDLYYEKTVEEDYEDDEEDFEVARWGGDSDEEEESGEGEGGEGDMFDLDERMIFAIALRAAAQLEQGGFINHVQKAKLKEKILDAEEEIISVVVRFVESNDASTLMQHFRALAEA